MSYPARPITILDVIKLDCILFIDIETVPAAPSFDDLSPEWQQLWIEKSRKYASEGLTPEDLYFLKAGIHAEFGKVVCISVGHFPTNPQGGPPFRVKSFAGDDEHALLTGFKSLLDGFFNDCNRHFLCAHNGIEFDFPFLARRMLINRIALPSLLHVSGSKSWNNKWLIDTMDLWRFGDYKEKTSLKLLAACFGIDSPKDDISGSDVARVYYMENDLGRIANYCQKDVVTLSRIFHVFAGLTPVEDHEITFI